MKQKSTSLNLGSQTQWWGFFFPFPILREVVFPAHRPFPLLQMHSMSKEGSGNGWQSGKLFHPLLALNRRASYYFMPVLYVIVQLVDKIWEKYKRKLLGENNSDFVLKCCLRAALDKNASSPSLSPLMIKRKSYLKKKSQNCSKRGKRKKGDF